MTLQDLFIELSRMSESERQALEVKVFDYKLGEWLKLPELAVCREGEPAFHLTIN